MLRLHNTNDESFKIKKGQIFRGKVSVGDRKNIEISSSCISTLSARVADSVDNKREQGADLLLKRVAV